MRHGNLIYRRGGDRAEEVRPVLFLPTARTPHSRRSHRRRPQVLAGVPDRHRPEAGAEQPYPACGTKWRAEARLP